MGISSSAAPQQPHSRRTIRFTFAATVEMIVLLGGKPVFADIEADTCNLDASLVEAQITARTVDFGAVTASGRRTTAKSSN